MTSWFAALVGWWATLLGPGDADPECLLLGRLDALRTQALVAGDSRALADVYASDELHRRDADLLADYAARGLRLDGAAQLRLSCAVVRADAGRVELDVVDRLGPTRVVSAEAAQWLPADAPTRRTVVLTETADGWRVAASGAG